jgi:hypothetical protein
MKREAGLILSEVVAMSLLMAVALGVAFGIYVGSVRDGVVESAEVSLKEIEAAIVQAQENEWPITCRDSLVGVEVLQNDYLSMTIKPMRISLEENKGYGVGVFIESSRDRDGNDAFTSAEKLEKSLSESDDYTVRLSLQGEDDIAYGILISETGLCQRI